jgi:hypothetical protein
LPARVSRVAIVAMVVLPEILSDPVLVTDQFPVPTPEEYPVFRFAEPPLSDGQNTTKPLDLMIKGLVSG